MSLQVSAIMLGVKDVDRAKRFYAEGLGCEIDQDSPGSSGAAWVRILDAGALRMGAAAQDAGVSAEGSGFRGVSFHHVCPDLDVGSGRVGRLLRTAPT